MASMPVFGFTNGTYREANGRFALWKFAKQVNGGKHIRYAHQLTGSCVGAGGSNMLRTLARVEIAQGDLETYPPDEFWWLYTYGRSRYRSGMRGQGEGSTGSGWAEAIVQDGIFASAEAEGQNLPAFEDDGDGWIQVPQYVEMEWSDGGRFGTEPWTSLGRVHPVGSATPVGSAEEAKAALANGYPLTLASMFGTNTIRPAGNPQVNLASWDGSWSHQMYCDEAWDHPSLGLIFRIGNNWGARAHPQPLGEEPPGGFYITARDMNVICRSEVFAFSKFKGLKLRELDWFI